MGLQSSIADGEVQQCSPESCISRAVHAALACCVRSSVHPTLLLQSLPVRPALLVAAAPCADGWEETTMVENFMCTSKGSFKSVWSVSPSLCRVSFLSALLQVWGSDSCTFHSSCCHALPQLFFFFFLIYLIS